jgi:hypothetical protein
MPEPKYIVADTNTLEWQAVPGSTGIEVKFLGNANG